MPQLKRILAVLSLLCAIPVWSLTSTTIHWDVRSDGSDTNGGFFDSNVTSPGTDYSAQAAAQVAFTDIVIGSTTTTFTSSAHPATTAYPGNGLYISGGSGCTVGWYKIVSQSSGTYTVDSSLGTASSTCTGNLGGALQTLQTAMTHAYNGNFINLKAATYTFASIFTYNQATSLSIIGYQNTFNDGGTKPILAVSGVNSLFSMDGSSLVFNNVSFVGDGTHGPAFYASGTYFGTLAFTNCYITDWGATGTDGGGFVDDTNNTNWGIGLVAFYNSEATANSALVNGGYTNGAIVAVGNYFHADVTEFWEIATATLVRNIFANDTASGHGPVVIDYAGSQIAIGNVFYESANYGYDVTFSTTNALADYDNIFWGNPIAQSGSGNGFAFGLIGHNAYGNNTVNTDVAPDYFPPLGPTDIVLTADPFVNDAGGNFALNNVAGGGALLRANGYPTAYGTGTTNGVDVGPVQGAGSSGTTAANTGFTN